MTTKTPEPQYRATMARNGRKGAGRKLSAKRKAALERATETKSPAWMDRRGLTLDYRLRGR